ncbi:uncharacterized protein LOC110073140 [Pogona vitticeps]
MSDGNVLRKPAVVIDNGSGWCKAGIAGQSLPWSILPSAVGRFEEDANTCYIGKRALSKEGVSLNYPVRRGVISDWDDMEKLWRHVYEEELKVEASTCPVLLSERPLNPLHNRVKMTELMFERFMVPALYLSVQAVLAAYASARIMGLVVDSGNGVTHTVPVYDGHCLPHGVVQLDLAGKDITEHLANCLWKNNNAPLSRKKRKIVKALRKNFCYVALEPHLEAQKKVEKLLTLPDGNAMKINFHFHQMPEILFAPQTVSVDAPGLPAMITESIKRCDKDICTPLYKNVILSGGSSLFRGLEERLYKEVEQHIPEGALLRIATPSNRSCAAWIGGSVIARLASFEPMWFTREEYGEFGASGVNRKCF